MWVIWTYQVSRGAECELWDIYNFAERVPSHREIDLLMVQVCM